MASKCKVCGTPIYSTFERDQGTCTRCLHESSPSDIGRAKQVAADRKPARTQTPPTSTSNRAKTRPHVDVVPQATSGESQANCITVGTRISKDLQAKLNAYLDASGETQSRYIRSLLENALS